MYLKIDILALAGKANKLWFFLDIFSALTLSQELVFIIVLRPKVDQLDLLPRDWNY
jgi:hypothetical protein